MIPPRVLRELRYIEIAAVRAVRGGRAGAHTSRVRGTGFDFDQHVLYRPGDDVRRLDWNVMARLNAPYLRQTHAEHDLELVMAIDVSRSMELGSGPYSKKEVMTFISASLLFSAAADGVNAGFLAFADRVLRWVPPRQAAGRSWQMLEEIWSLDASRTTTHGVEALRHLAKHLRTMSVVVIISDFLTDDDVFGSAELRMLAARHDVIALLLDDAADAALPPGQGFLRVRDVETGRMTTLALNERSRHAYAEGVARRKKRMADACHSMGIEFVPVRPDTPVVQPVLELFARRRLS